MASTEIAGYRELFPLREGMSSDLYRTQLPAAERWVAVKVFRFTLPDEAAERRWRYDCQRARSLSAHPNLVTLYDAGLTQDRRPYITMQLVESGSVADRLSLSSHGTYAPAEAARICAEACEGLAAGHAAGVVHRLLQPSNILLTTDGTPLLTELGITLFSPRWETAGYLDEAVPHHTAPEVLERDAPGPAADVYSMASVLYMMLTGAPPHHDADSSSARLLHILQHKPEPIEAPGVTPQLNAILGSALAADPAKRPPNASELGQALADVLPQLEAQQRQLASAAAATPPDQVEDTAADEPAAPPAPPPPPVPTPGLYDYVEPSHDDQPDRMPSAGPTTDPEPMRVAGSARPLRDEGAPDRAAPQSGVPSPSAASESVRPTSGVGLAVPEPTGVAPYEDDVRRWKRRAIIAVAAAVTILLAFLADNLGGGDDTPEASEEQEHVGQGGERSEGGTPTSVRPADEETGSTTTGGDDPDDPPTPTGLTAHESDAGVQLEWDESDTSRFAVLVLSETSSPQVMTTSSGSSLFIPTTELEPDDGYCFAVARLDAITGDDPTDQEDLGPAFSSVHCIRGAAEDTVRTS